jgi:hypothetical protein
LIPEDDDNDLKILKANDLLFNVAQWLYLLKIGIMRISFGDLLLKGTII